jgi:hypothetical protein
MLCLPRDLRVRRDATVRPFRSRLEDDDVVEVDGVRVTSPLRTAFDLARTSHLSEAVSAIDYLARGRPQFLVDLGDFAREHSTRKGSRLVVAALRRATALSRSTGETRLRLFWTAAAGLPDPLVNPLVRLDDGFLLGMPDLLDPTARLVGEYDGAGHRDQDRHAADNAREERLEAAGLVVVRFGAVDLASARRLQSRHRLLEAWRRGRADGSRRRWSAEDGPLPPPTPHW